MEEVASESEDSHYFAIFSGIGRNCDWNCYVTSTAKGLEVSSLSIYRGEINFKAVWFQDMARNGKAFYSVVCGLALLFASLFYIRPWSSNSSKVQIPKRTNVHVEEQVEAIYEKNMPGLLVFNYSADSTCFKTCSFNKSSKLLLNTRGEIDEINYKLEGPSILMNTVTTKRRTATALLTISAILSCEVGDIVETGVYTGGSSAMIMRMLMSLDNCNRKFWVFDSFLGRYYDCYHTFHYYCDYYYHYDCYYCWCYYYCYWYNSSGLPPLDKKDFAGEDINGIPGDFQFSQKDFVNNMKKVDAWDEKRIIITKG